MSLQSNTNNDIFIIPSQSLMRFSGSNGNNIILQVEPSGAVNFVGTTGSILKIMDNLSGSLFSVNNISGLSILEVLSNNQVKLGNPTNYALVISGSNVIITGSLVDKGTGIKFLVVDTATGVVHTTGSGGGGGGSPTTPASPVNSIQYNNAGAFGGVPTLAYSSSFGLIATGSFTGSFTGSLLGTASWAQSASQAVTASHIRVTSNNTGTLTVDLTTPGEIKLTAITSSTSPAGTSNELQYSAGGGLFGAVASSSYNNGTSQLTLGKAIVTGSLFGTASWAASASQAITASYVNIQAGPRIQAVNYNTSSGVTTITGSIGGSDTHLQFNSGSAFSGSSDLVWSYVSRSLNIRTGANGKYISFNPGGTSVGAPNPYAYISYGSSNNSYGGLRIVSYRNSGAGSSPFTFVGLTNAGNAALVAGIEFETQVSTSFGTDATTSSQTSSLYSPVLAVMGRPTQISAAGIPVQVGNTIASFQVWADGKTLVGPSYNPAPGTYPNPSSFNKALFSTRGSIALLGTGSSSIGVGGFQPETTVNPTYTTASAQGFNDNTAMYFGSPGAVGSWRIILSGSGNNSTLNIERWNSVSNTYGKDAVFTSGSIVEL